MKHVRIMIWMAVLVMGLSGCSSYKTKPAQCNVKPDPGMCKAAFKKVYYNPETYACETFLWGGCGGSVPFDSMVDCQATCE